MAIEKGDVVELMFVGKVKGNGVFQETKEPTPMIVGMKKLIPGLDEALLGMEEGEKKTVEVSPEKGYGQRDQSLVKLIPLSAFKKSGITPVPGAVIDIEGYPARILTVSGGRVQVDFNHELAGKTLIFDVEVKKIHKTDKEKAEVLTNKYMGDKAGVDVKDKISVRVNEDIMLAKDYIDRKVMLIRELVALGKPVDWIEEYKMEDNKE